MPYGIEIFAPDGKLIMDGSGRYARIIDIFDPYTTGVPGSKSFPSFSPEDIQAIAPAVLAHRLILNFEAEAKGINTLQIVQELLKAVKTP